MKETKFKVWDKLKNKMISEGVEWNIGMINEHKDDFELMQFTGLKDKNGKEIFEGDIIKATYEQEFEFGEVFWDNDSASFDIRGDNWKSMENLQEAPQYYEVIGNIYENPELLEAKE